MTFEKDHVRADATGLFLHGKRVVTRDRIAAGFVVVRADEHIVRLRPRYGRPIDVGVPSRAEGQRLLRALDLGAESFVATYWTRVDERPGPAPVVAFMVYLGAYVLAGPIAPLLAAAATGIAAFFALRVRYRVRVGADGVEVRRFLSRPRFIPHDAMKPARHAGKTVVLRARNGTDLTMITDAESASGLVDDVNDRIALARRRTGDAAAATLRRDGRPVDEWLRAIADAAGSQSYRALATPPDVLWRVAEDPTAPPTARAAAAFALRRHDDGDARVRIAQIAESSMATKLRVALETIASDEEEAEVRRALEALDDSA